MARFYILPLLAGVALTGCGKGTNPDNSTQNYAIQPGVSENIEDIDTLGNGAPAAGRLPTDEWVGRWKGPEGLFLDIQPSPDGQAGHYAISNQDTLDRKADYSGVAEGSTIRFVRDGKDLAIRPGKGSETGFKYLADKDDCLIVLPGREGYCR